MARSTSSREDKTYRDAEGVTIHYYVWKAARPKAVIQLLHGLGEYATRYEWLVSKLTAAGYTVYADDHRGHGQTGLGQNDGDYSKLGKLGPGGMRATIEAVRKLTRIIRAESGKLPLVLLGHSWGSIIAQILLNKHAEDYDAAVLSGSALRTFTHMNGGDLNAKHKHEGGTGYEWLSRDPKVVATAAEDPFMFVAKALPTFGVLDSLRLLGRPAHGIESDIPVLIQAGGDDSFGGEKSVTLLAKEYRTTSELTDVELIVYPNARHEIFNETNKEEVVADTLAWLSERVA